MMQVNPITTAIRILLASVTAVSTLALLAAMAALMLVTLLTGCGETCYCPKGSTTRPVMGTTQTGTVAVQVATECVKDGVVVEPICE